MLTKDLAGAPYISPGLSASDDIDILNTKDVPPCWVNPDRVKYIYFRDRRFNLPYE